jgi:hypothetical protein
MAEVDPSAVHDTADPDATTDHRPPCPCCGGRMIIVEVFSRGEEGVISHAKAMESIEGVAEILCEMAVRDREFQASRSTAQQPHKHAAARVGLIEQLRESFIVKMEPPP